MENQLEEILETPQQLEILVEEIKQQLSEKQTLIEERQTNINFKLQQKKEISEQIKKLREQSIPIREQIFDLKEQNKSIKQEITELKKQLKKVLAKIRQLKKSIQKQQKSESSDKAVSEKKQKKERVVKNVEKKQRKPKQTTQQLCDQAVLLNQEVQLLVNSILEKEKQNETQIQIEEQIISLEEEIVYQQNQNSQIIEEFIEEIIEEQTIEIPEQIVCESQEIEIEQVCIEQIISEQIVCESLEIEQTFEIPEQKAVQEQIVEIQEQIIEIPEQKPVLEWIGDEQKMSEMARQMKNPDISNIRLSPIRLPRFSKNDKPMIQNLTTEMDQFLNTKKQQESIQETINNEQQTETIQKDLSNYNFEQFACTVNKQSETIKQIESVKQQIIENNIEKPETIEQQTIEKSEQDIQKLQEIEEQKQKRLEEWNRQQKIIVEEYKRQQEINDAEFVIEWEEKQKYYREKQKEKERDIVRQEFYMLLNEMQNELKPEKILTPLISFENYEKGLECHLWETVDRTYNRFISSYFKRYDKEYVEFINESHLKFKSFPLNIQLIEQLKILREKFRLEKDVEKAKYLAFELKHFVKQLLMFQILVDDDLPELEIKFNYDKKQIEYYRMNTPIVYSLDRFMKIIPVYTKNKRTDFDNEFQEPMDETHCYEYDKNLFENRENVKKNKLQYVSFDFWKSFFWKTEIRQWFDVLNTTFDEKQTPKDLFSYIKKQALNFYDSK